MNDTFSPCDFNVTEGATNKNVGANGKSKSKSRSGCKHSEHNLKFKDSKALSKGIAFY